MESNHGSWRMFFIRLVEIVVIVNIAVLDILALQNFSQYRASIANSIQTKQIITPTTTPIPTLITPAPVITQVIQQTGPKEIYVPLGTGSSTATVYTNVPGVIAYINSVDYPHIKQAVFEANVNVPTANETVWLQLYDMTTQHPVWNSEIQMTGATQYITSSPITLDNGNNLYQVQMYTQLGYPAQLTFARVHITLD